MTHSAARRARGARALLRIACQLRRKAMRRSDGRIFKIPHPDVREFQRLCAVLARRVEREARNFRRRRG